MLFDSHAHLDDQRFDSDRETVIRNACNNGVQRIINVGADIKSSYSTLELAKKYDFIFGACGIHPHEAKTYSLSIEKQLYEIAKNPNTVAIGEIGLDYHYDNSPRDKQKEVFARQIVIARKIGLPIIIHDREAHRDCIDILNTVMKPGQTGVFHSYSGSAEMVKAVVKMGFYVSFTGVITFKNARKTVEASAAVPVDRILVETDCPYLSPEPKRGVRNIPDNVKFTADKLAHIHGIETDRFYEILWNNTHRLFKRLPKFPYMIK